jgi:hypothetical protein|tara:strand:+ start:183 stop:407 length:225 start_codon:yes stop_codon:yes gene_type:complete
LYQELVPDPKQATDARYVLLPHRDEQLIRLLSVLLRQLQARLLRFRHRRATSFRIPVNRPIYFFSISNIALDRR